MLPQEAAHRGSHSKERTVHTLAEMFKSEDPGAEEQKRAQRATSSPGPVHLCCHREERRSQNRPFAGRLLGLQRDTRLGFASQRKACFSN